MNTDISGQLPENFDGASKVWIYQCNRLFYLGEALEIEEMLEQFVAGWKSHGAEVKGYANLFFGRFIILMADERQSGVSGCSTDSSVRLIKEIEKKYNVQLFDRQLLAFVIDNKIEMLPLSQAAYAASNGFIKPDTLYFNNTVLTKQELLDQWIIPAKESWLAKRVQFATLA